jgi:RNA polymerase sigma factor (sigma-70 family)
VGFVACAWCQACGLVLAISDHDLVGHALSIVDKNFQVYVTHRQELVDYATAIVGDRAGGEDVVQEAFLRLRTATLSQTLDEPIAYLRRIVRNLAIDLTRRLSHERRRYDSATAAETVPENRATQEETLSHRDDLRIVMKAMAELPERTRIALEMHRFEARKLREIAVALGISVTSAHALVYEGLEHCRKRLIEGQ